MLQNELVDPAGNSFLVMSLCNVINNKIVNSIQAILCRFIFIVPDDNRKYKPKIVRSFKLIRIANCIKAEFFLYQTKSILLKRKLVIYV